MRISEHAAETDDSGMSDYLAYKAEAERRQSTYLAFLQSIPSVFLRTHEQQEEADRLDWEHIQANRKARNAERDAYWTRYDERHGIQVSQGASEP